MAGCSERPFARVRLVPYPFAAHYQVGQIITKVFVKGDRPEVPVEAEDEMPEYVALMRRCWATSPDDRPSANEVVDVLVVVAHDTSSRRRDALVRPSAVTRIGCVSPG